MALPIPRTLAEPAAPAGPRAGLRRAIGARSPLRGTLPKALSLCKRSFVISRSLDYRLCRHAPAHTKWMCSGRGGGAGVHGAHGPAVQWARPLVTRLNVSK